MSHPDPTGPITSTKTDPQPRESGLAQSSETAALPWTDVAERAGTDAERGLAATVATERLEEYGPNELASEPPVPAWRRFLAQFQDPLIYLLLAAIVVSVIAWVIEGASGAPFDAIVIAVIVLANAVLGFVQEARAEQSVAALARMSAPHATVVRDGAQREIPAAEVVPGDLLVLSEGDAVAADARVVRASQLRIAEASLTGESAPVGKSDQAVEPDAALGDRTSMVFSGTAVMQGTGLAVVTATGMDTEMGRIATMLSETESEQTPLQSEVARVGKMLGLAVIVIAVVVMATIFATSDVSSAEDAIAVLLLGVSLAVAAVPEGLPAILTVVLALGVQRMAKRHAIVKRLHSVETLGSASVICSDKTGTLTRNEMTVQVIATPSGTVRLAGTGYAPVGEVSVESASSEAPAGGNGSHGSGGDRAVLEESRRILWGGALASNARLDQDENGEWAIQGDPTEAAFLVAERKLDAELPTWRDARFDRMAEAPFTAERKRMSTLNSDAESDDLLVVAKGAPDVLLASCSRIFEGDAVRDLDDARRERILATVEDLSSAAYRTLAVAMSRRPESDAPGDGEEAEADDLERELIYAGCVGIIDPPRTEVRDSISEAHSAGIRTVMITGDHPATASRIAQDLGLSDSPAALSGAELDRLDDDDFDDAVRTTDVYARVAPQHKLKIVDALQAQGKVVAMTGDGVNDAPALKSADIGVAMGITGTEVTKEASTMILADDDFSTIVAAVEEGRGIFDNIRKFLRYLLSSNMGEVLTVFLGVVFAGVIGISADTHGELVLPLLATQILWINLLTDSAPALAMGVDPPADGLMKRAPRRLQDRVIDGRMWFNVILIGAVMAASTLLAMDACLPGGVIGTVGSLGSDDLTTARTVAFTTLVFAQLFNTVNCRSGTQSAFRHLFTNKWLWGAIALSIVLQVIVIYLPFLNVAFGTAPLDIAHWILAVVASSFVLWVEEIKKVIERALQARRSRSTS